MKMKNIIKISSMVMLVSCMAVGCTEKTKTQPPQETHYDTIPHQEYTIKGKVIYEDNGTFTIATRDGNEWQVYAEGFSIDDIVEVTFDNNETYNIFDDSIIGLNNLSK